jgi:hypothetical protein
MCFRSRISFFEVFHASISCNVPFILRQSRRIPSPLRVIAGTSLSAFIPMYTAAISFAVLHKPIRTPRRTRSGSSWGSGPRHELCQVQPSPGDRRRLGTLSSSALCDTLSVELRTARGQLFQYRGILNRVSLRFFLKILESLE